MSGISSNKIIIQNTAADELTKQEIESDVKYQDITYHMYDKSKTVDSKDHIHIDFLKAMSEMSGLDWNYEKNYIGFINKRTTETVQFIRQGQDKWYAEVLIHSGKNWDGYTWSCYSESRPISDMMRLFFEETSWMGTLSWKMRRFKH